MKRDDKLMNFKTVLALLASLCISNLSTAAEIVDVMDAAEPDNPIDVRLDVNYDRALRRSKITRELNCYNQPLCPQRPGEVGYVGKIVNVKELRYERITQRVVPKLRIGMYHDLEFAVTMPIVVGDTQGIRFAGDGGKRNSQQIDGTISSISTTRTRQFPDGDDEDMNPDQVPEDSLFLVPPYPNLMAGLPE
ncbi:MAG: hypothetical protein ACPGQS_09045, partial [Bradymonadia bacterium]